MNIYEKLQKARVLLQNTQIKKSGINPYARYEYFELSDFLPTINKIMDDLKFSSVLKIINDKALLLIINSETPSEKIVFSVPFVIPELKGTNSIQNIGAGITYIRRYLLTIAFEIVEHDVVDSQPLNSNDTKVENLKDLENLYFDLLKCKLIPEDKKEDIEKMSLKIKEGKTKPENIKNAIKYLEGLPEIENKIDKAIKKFEKIIKEG